MFMVGDSRFDMEAARDTAGVTPLGRASRFSGWALTPSDLKEWGAAWADYTLAELPEVLDRLARPKGPRRTGGARRASPRRR